MKKIKYILFVLLAFFIFNVDAKAFEADYSVKNYYMDATITSNGDLKVREALVTKGDINGYERELYFSNSKLSSSKYFNFENNSIYNPSDITDFNVSAYKVNKNDSFDDVLDSDPTYFEKVSSASSGTSGKYTLAEYTNQAVIRTYNSCQSCTVAFYLEYTVKDVVVLHNDVAEVYYQIIGEDFWDDIDNVEIRVHLPEQDKSENFRVWAHGNLAGEIWKNDDKDGMTLTISNLRSGEGVDFRTTFDTSLVDETLIEKQTGIDATDGILEVEQERADEANRKREKQKLIIKILQYIAVGYLIMLVILWIYIGNKYDKEYKSEFDGEYYREFIEDYDVEVIDYLFNKTITPNAMSASIMNLIYKKKISAEKLGEKDYTFTLITRDGLSDNENKLVDFLFEKVGNDTTFTTKELKAYAKSTSTYSKFQSSYDSWKNAVVKEGVKQQFYESVGRGKVIGVLYSILGFIIFVISLQLVDGFILGHILILPALIFFIYCCSFTRKTKKGIEHYNKWKAFKKFLTDFGSFSDKELPEVILWERYLVYAVVFGIANKVQKDMNVKIQEMEELNPGMNYHTFIAYDYLRMSHIVNSSVSSAVSAAASTQAAQAARSSGSGGGGGFSGGGGFGGGGGGGHGF